MSPVTVWPLNIQRYVTPCASVEPEAVSVKVFWFVSAPGSPATTGFGEGAVVSSVHVRTTAWHVLPNMSVAVAESAYSPSGRLETEAAPATPFVTGVPDADSSHAYVTPFASEAENPKS